MEESIRRTYELTASDIDCHRRLRLSNLLAYLQNIATDHAEVLEIGGDRMLREYGAFWMMVRSHLTLRRPITYEDGAVMIHTWHRGAGKSATVFRDFDIYVGEELVGEAVASWVIVDVEARRILKPSTISVPAMTLCPDRVKEIVPTKISMPDDLDEMVRRVVRYSDTDINGHMNNTRYGDVACDVLGYEQFTDRFVSEMQINYLQESFPGDELGILSATVGETHFVRGVGSSGEPRFDVRMEMSGV